MKTWGIGLGLDQAQGFNDIVSSAGTAFLMLLFMDMVITGPTRWFEQHIDFMCARRVGPTTLPAASPPGQSPRRWHFPYAH